MERIIYKTCPLCEEKLKSIKFLGEDEVRKNYYCICKNCGHFLQEDQGDVIRIYHITKATLVRMVPKIEKSVDYPVKESL